MTVSQKISVSLLISVVLFAGFAALAFTGLFSLVETRFYNPAVARGLSRDVEEDVASVGEFMEELQDRFGAVLEEGSVRRSFLPNQGAEDIFERTKLFGTLMESLPGLQSVRFVDSSGKRIHFSTLKIDTIRQDRLAVSYRNYGESDGDIPYESVAAPETGNFRLVVDSPRDRIVFSFPFKDSFDIYKGSALFSVSVRAFAERMIVDGRLRVGEDLYLVPDPAGVVSGLPKVGREGLTAAVSQALKDGSRGLIPLARSTGGKGYALIGGKTRGGFFVARMVGEDLFLFPPAMKAILLASFFLTVFLVVFLFLNLHQDSMVVARERIRRFQRSLLEEYYDRKEEIDWDRWSRELNQRREEVRVEMKRGLGRAVKKRNEADIDALIDKSWDELISAVGSRISHPPAAAPTAQIDERKLQDILGRILATTPVSVARAAPAASAAEELEELDEVEELGEIEEADEAEELDEVEELGEVEEAEEAEELDEVEEAVEVEELDEVEELGEVEEVEGLAESEPAPELTAAAPAAQGAEELEAAEDLDELEELEQAEGLDEEAEPAELEELEEIEDIPPEEPQKTPYEEIASRIEFSPSEGADEACQMPEMKVSSPFDTLFAQIGPGQGLPEQIEELAAGHDDGESSEEISVPMVIDSAPLAYRPFSPSGSGREELALLESPDGAAEDDAAELLEAEEPVGGSSGTYIVFKNGLAYVADSAYREDSEAEGNRDLKNLAEAVIGQRR